VAINGTLTLHLVDNANGWNELSDTQEITLNIPANTNKSGTITFTVNGTASASTANANMIHFYISPTSAASGQPTLTFSVFSLVKDTKDGGDSDSGSLFTGGTMTWIPVTDSTFGSSLIRAITYGNGRFVAVGDDSKLAYSTNGETWTAVPPGTGAGTNTFQTGNSLGSVTWGKDKFVVGSGGKMAYSPDGANWTAVADSKLVSSFISGIVWGEDKFVAVSYNPIRMAYSPDGINWTAITNIPFPSVTYPNTVNAIAWGNDKFVAVGSGGKMAYSSDGINWTPVADSKTTDDIISIAWGNNKFVAGGRNYDRLYSSDGINWTKVKSSNFSNRGLAWGNDKFVMVGSGYMSYSSDGINWSIGKNFILETAYALTFGNGKFVAGQGGSVNGVVKDGKMAWTTGVVE